MEGPRRSRVVFPLTWANGAQLLTIGNGLTVGEFAEGGYALYAQRHIRENHGITTFGARTISFEDARAELRDDPSAILRMFIGERQHDEVFIMDARRPALDLDRVGDWVRDPSFIAARDSRRANNARFQILNISGNPVCALFATRNIAPDVEITAYRGARWWNWYLEECRTALIRAERIGRDVVRWPRSPPTEPESESDDSD